MIIHPLKISKFQFSNPNLIKLVFEINPNFDEELFESLKLESQTKIIKTQGQNTANVEMCLDIGGMKKEYPFAIKIIMASDFKWKDELEEALVDKLLKANAPSLILSYMRPIVSNITNNSKYSVFNLPFLDMQNNEADIEEI